MHDLISPAAVLCLVILLLIVLLKNINQPYLVAYILAGIILGPYLFGLFSRPEDIAGLGDIGIILLMFFLGMEINIPDQRSLLMKPMIAQGIKMLLCIICAGLLSVYLHWTPGRILLLSALLIFNSTAIVSEFLRSTGDLDTPMGKTVLNMLLLQDILVAPVFTIFRLMDSEFNLGSLLLSIIICLLLFFLLRAIRHRNIFQWPGWKQMQNDHDLQVFLALFICLGFALLASLAGLPAAIGAFAAGVYLGKIDAFHWLGTVLHPFKVFFTALFFVSIGLMLDLRFIQAQLGLILAITVSILAINSLLSAIVFRLLNHTWSESLYGGALLSQAGEFGLLAGTVAYKAGLIDEGFLKMELAVAGLTLLLSTLWMTGLRRLTKERKTSVHPLDSLTGHRSTPKSPL